MVDLHSAYGLSEVENVVLGSKYLRIIRKRATVNKSVELECCESVYLDVFMNNLAEIQYSVASPTV